MKRRDFILAWAAFLAACRDRIEDGSGLGAAFEVPPMPAARPLGNLTSGDAARSASASSSAAPAVPVLGINSHILEEPDLRLIRELGITHVRSTIYTSLWTDVPGFPAAMRQNAERAASYGLKLLYVVHNAFGDVFRLRHDRDTLRRYTRLMTEIVRGVPDVEAWQLWNEQDVWVQAPFGAGEVPRHSAQRVGENYARWWREAYAAIKDVRPDALLVTGGTADHHENRWRGFLQGMMETGIEADAIGFHAYGPWERSGPMLREASGFVAGRAPIWLTECGGLPGPHWTPAYHAAAWRSVIEGNEREQLAERVYPYALQTDPNDPWHGVHEVDGRPRPVLEWLRRHTSP